MKKDKWPKYKQGKFYGYKEFEDGTIQIAPLYADKMRIMFDSRMAIDKLLQSITNYCHNLLVPLVKEERDVWDSITEDYELDHIKYSYKYNAKTNLMTKIKKETHV